MQYRIVRLFFNKSVHHMKLMSINNSSQHDSPTSESKRYFYNWQQHKWEDLLSFKFHYTRFHFVVGEALLAAERRQRQSGVAKRSYVGIPRLAALISGRCVPIICLFPSSSHHDHFPLAFITNTTTAITNLERFFS